MRRGVHLAPYRATHWPRLWLDVASRRAGARSSNLLPVPYLSPGKCFEPVNLFRYLQNKRSPCGRRRTALLVRDDTWPPFPSSSAPPPLPRGPMLRRRHGSVPRKKDRLFCKAESAQLCSTLGVGGRGGGRPVLKSQRASWGRGQTRPRNDTKPGERLLCKHRNPHTS